MSLYAEFALKTVYDGAPRKYLGCLSEGNLKGYLQYSVPVVSRTAKFAVEPSKEVKELVHIRCCSNNKYWARSSGSENWIIAEASKPEEKQSEWNCTLFKPTYVEYQGSAAVEFVHIQSGTTVGLSVDPAYKFCLCLPPLSSKVATSFAIDYGSIVILPKYVTFRGDNDNLLKAFFYNHPFLQYGTKDVGSELVVQEVFPTDDGDVRMKNQHFGKFWRRSPNWIWADSTDTTTNNPDTLFSVVKVADDVVSFRCLGNNLFCKRLTADGKESCLNAGIDSITKEARMQVVEPVLTRSVTVLQFRTADARIYNRTPLVLATKSQKNGTNTTQKMNLQFTYTDTRTSNWSNSITVKVGVSTTFKTGVPVIFEGKVTVSAEISDQFQWGQTVQVTKQVQFGDTLDVPPRTMVKATLMATQGSCDVPFSYTQTDQLNTGERVTVTLEDGVYNGVNAYDVFTEVVEEPLPSEEWEH